MQKIEALFERAKKQYNSGRDACNEIKATAEACIEKIDALAIKKEWSGPNEKAYLIFQAGDNLSRPFLKTHLISAKEFTAAWDLLLTSGNRNFKRFDLSEAQVTSAIYNAVVPFCVCFDVWKPKSRKTPGTFFEIVLGTLMARILPVDVKRSKHIQLPTYVQQELTEIVNETKPAALLDVPHNELVLKQESAESIVAGDGGDTDIVSSDADMSQVATDIVFEFKGGGLIIPAKTTTRERIVQPFAHQRILDGVFGEGRYTSLLVCVSETQRADKTKRVNEICVPGTITLFQKHLAKLGGIYYLDPPERYLKLAKLKVITVGSLGDLFTSGVAAVFMRLNPIQPAVQEAGQHP